MSRISHCLRIGTRRSPLALAQAAWVQQQLAQVGLVSELVTFETVGDRTLTHSLPKLVTLGSKGLFTAELESALQEQTIDLAVHSLKDLPTELSPALPLLAITARAAAGDALVLSPVHRAAERTWQSLPTGTRIGTSSLRRQQFLSLARPDLEFIDLRGNLQTRLHKIANEAAGLEAGVLAVAGLSRAAETSQIAQILPTELLLPAPGQGALGIQVARSQLDSPTLQKTKQALHCPLTACCCQLERQVLAGISGGCQTPFGAFAEQLSGEPLIISLRTALIDATGALRHSAGQLRLPDLEPPAALLAGFVEQIVQGLNAQ